MIIGFLGELRSPIVQAMGMPRSMWVPWLSSLERESRMAAQLAPLETVDSIPYFLKRPFSCAMTIGEQSVSAMIPNLRAVVSGASLAYAAPTQLLGRPAKSVARAAPLTVLPRNSRRFCSGEDEVRFG